MTVPVIITCSILAAFMIACFYRMVIELLRAIIELIDCVMEGE